MLKPTIILASASIGRKMLLQKLGVPFEIEISTIDEEAIIDTDPCAMLEKRARAKADDVAKILSEPFDSAQGKLRRGPIEINSKETSRLDSKNKTKPYLQNPNSSYLIIAADSMAILNNETFGKSKDKQHAAQIIRKLMGKTHVFATATSIVHVQQARLIDRWDDLSKTNVSMRSMTESEIEEYVTRYDFRRFAAAYTFNETPWDLITKIDGSYTNVIGLPFEVVLPIFRKFNLI